MQVKSVGVIFPSSFCYNKEEINNTVNFFKKYNINLIFARKDIKNFKGFCGTDEERVKEIRDIYSNKDADVVFAFNGGMGCNRILDLLHK